MEKFAVWLILGMAAISLLPVSPFTTVINAIAFDGNFLSWLNWLLPLTEIIVLVEAWATVYVLYLAVSLILRVAGVIR